MEDVEGIVAHTLHVSLCLLMISQRIHWEGVDLSVAENLILFRLRMG